MGDWVLAKEDARCGYGEGHPIPLDAPVYAMVGGKILRCEVHAPEHALEQTEAIERVCVAAEARRAAETASATPPASTPAVPGFASFRSTVAPDRMKRALEKRGIRTNAPRRPQPFAKVADVPDPKAHAFNK